MLPSDPTSGFDRYFCTPCETERGAVYVYITYTPSVCLQMLQHTSQNLEGTMGSLKIYCKHLLWFQPRLQELGNIHNTPTGAISRLISGNALTHPLIGYANLWRPLMDAFTFFAISLLRKTSNLASSLSLYTKFTALEHTAKHY